MPHWRPDSGDVLFRGGDHLLNPAQPFALEHQFELAQCVSSLQRPLVVYLAHDDAGASGLAMPCGAAARDAQLAPFKQTGLLQDGAGGAPSVAAGYAPAAQVRAAQGARSDVVQAGAAGGGQAGRAGALLFGGVL